LEILEPTKLFTNPGMMIGMVHLGPLPGTPHAVSSRNELIAKAGQDARTLAAAGFEMLIVENMGDRPYVMGSIGPEIVSAMTAACIEVRQAAPQLPLGVQVLAGANQAALAVALAAGADFIRAEGFVFASVADEGLMAEAAAGPLLRYRKMIGAQHIQILCDIKKKHSSHAITSDLGVGEIAKAAEFSGADGVIVTGSSTGQVTAPDDLREAALACGLPVLVGSGVTPEQVPDLIEHASGFIVGSYLKRGGRWDNELDGERAAEFVESVKRARA
jgi:membrane complex biogenesis BtpA family protein